MNGRKEEGPDFNENLLSDDHKQCLPHFNKTNNFCILLLLEI